jgi:peptidyl-prolyl cis-trans isomerase B (cyclophilin B)
MALTAAVAVLVVACGDDGEEEVAGLPQGCAEVEAPEPKQISVPPPPNEASGAGVARIETSCGDFEIALDSARAPRTTASFAHLVESGLYDGTTIHRVEPAYLIQGGDPEGNGLGGPGYFVDEPPPADTSYTRGTVAMAKSPAEPPGRSGSQFFVVTAPADAGLPPDYALLGEVSSGLETIDRIDQLDGPGDRPSHPVVIERITIKAR